jgi:hypothetical protein
MQFLALRSNRPIPAELNDGKYVHKVDVKCRKCNRVVYQLRAPLLEAESEQVQAQSEWLHAHLSKMCPEHRDWLLTPHRPT